MLFVTPSIHYLQEGDTMKVLNDTMRYQLLAEQLTLKQFQVDCTTGYYKEMEKSLTRIFWHVYTYSNVLYIDFIDEKLLVDYIKHHKKRNFQELDFIDAIKDVKHFLIFLEKFKKAPKIPQIDLSVNNVSLWTDI